MHVNMPIPKEISERLENTEAKMTEIVEGLERLSSQLAELIELQRAQT